MPRVRNADLSLMGAGSYRSETSAPLAVREGVRQTPRMPRAVQLTHAREAVVVNDVTLPALGKGEVVVEIEACALGQLDWNLLTLDAPPRLPLVPGHEAVGTVNGRRVLLTPLA